jgi:hypothetical protein
MNKFELTGTIIEMFPAQTFNKGFRKREFVIEVGDKYPQKILFQLVQEKCDMLESFDIGDIVAVAFDVKGRDWTDKLGAVKYFTTLEAWRISGQKKSGPIGITADAGEFDDDVFGDIDTTPSKPQAETNFDWSDDDLPF